NINLYEKVLNINKKDDLFLIKTSKTEYLSKNIIIATGFYDIPKMIGVKGEELPKVKHYYTEPYPYAKQKVVVVGASNSAVDAALEIYRKGADVTMIIKGDKISDSVKYWIKPDVENRIANGEIKAFFESELVEITENAVVFRDKKQNIHTIQNDFVLAMTGYLPDFEFLKNTGIELISNNLNPNYNPDTMETNVPNIYLAGVVCGGMDTHLWFIENSRDHAGKIINNILKKEIKN
ncbi:MAG: NAD(P)-binding domain-containing protein, partial [Bergeyella zoohelcum]|nr:NAD(P)-binding domain-containing protein [Bergeyella zoohelcum]